MIMIELSGRGHLPATPLGVRQNSKWGWGSRKSCQEKNRRKIYNIYIQVTYNSLINIQRYIHIVGCCRQPFCLIEGLYRQGSLTTISIMRYVGSSNQHVVALGADLSSLNDEVVRRAVAANEIAAATLDTPVAWRGVSPFEEGRLVRFSSDAAKCCASVLTKYKRLENNVLVDKVSVSVVLLCDILDANGTVLVEGQPVYIRMLARSENDRTDTDNTVHNYMSGSLNAEVLASFLPGMTIKDLHTLVVSFWRKAMNESGNVDHVTFTIKRGEVFNHRNTFSGRVSGQRLVNLMPVANK